VIDDDALDLIGHILEPIQHPLDVAIDFPTDEKNHRPCRAVLLEERCEAFLVEAVSPAFEMNDRFGDLVKPSAISADVSHQGDRLAHQLRGIAGKVGRFPHVRFELLEVVNANGLRGMPDLVDCIVQRGDQRGNRAAVERSDERTADRRQHVARNVVSFSLELSDAIDSLVDRTAAQQSCKLIDRTDQHRGVTLEQIEIPIVSRQYFVNNPAHLSSRIPG